jgi:threonine synthase
MTNQFTPITKIEYGGINIFLKREDHNPTKSFKDRSLSYQITHYVKQNIKEYVISSSGNAAISAAYYCKNYNCKLHIFVANKINKYKYNKLIELADDNIIIQSSDRPKSDAIKFASENKLLNLRGSLDNNALIGFEQISYELLQQVELIDAIFVPCSSGTSSLGIYNGFINNSHKSPAIHICQTTLIHSIAKEFDKDFTKENTHFADAISDRVAHRKAQIMKIISETNGFGWVISNQQLQQAAQLINQLINENISYNSILSLAGLLKAIDKGYNFRNIVLIISGS